MISVLLASLRRPAPLIGSLVALTLSALIIVIASALHRHRRPATGPVDRLAGAAVVVTGSQQLTVHADGVRSRCRCRTTGAFRPRWPPGSLRCPASRPRLPT